MKELLWADDSRYILTLNVDDIRRRIEAKLVPSNGCLVWSGRRDNSKYDYGTIKLGGRAGRWFPVHRVLWVITNGLIPDSMIVMHSCDNCPCANLDHISLGYSIDNTSDMIMKGRGWWQTIKR